MARIRLQIALIGVLCAIMEVVVLCYEFLELRLHVDELVGGEFEFGDGHARVFEVFEEAELGGLEEEEGTAFGVGAASGTADAVDVVAGVVWGVELEDPVDGGDLIGLVLVHRKMKGKLTSKPLAATSVQINVAVSAFLNSKKVFVRFCCFCFPCKSSTGKSM